MINYSVVETLHGKLYLRKLCRHFAHKVPVTFTESQGRIEFPFGPCRIEVDDTQMSLSIEVEDLQQAALAEDVINRHLLRMANKDQPEIEWQRESLDVKGSKNV